MGARKQALKVVGVALVHCLARHPIPCCYANRKRPRRNRRIDAQATI
jgi:hypothetical protein